MKNNLVKNNLLSYCAGSALFALLAFPPSVAEAGIHLHGEIRMAPGGQVSLLYDSSGFPIWGYSACGPAHLRLFPRRHAHLRHQGHLPRLLRSRLESQAALSRPLLACGRLPRTPLRASAAWNGVPVSPSALPSLPPQAPLRRTSVPFPPPMIPSIS